VIGWGRGAPSPSTWLTRPATGNARRIGAQLRRRADPHLVRRRRVVVCALGAIAAMGGVALYQTGVCRHLPDPPLPFVDSDRVTGSGSAYWLLETPDALLAMVSYAVTAVLAGAGGADRWRRRPWLPLLLWAKLSFDALAAALLIREEVARERRVCAWCLAASAAAVVALPQGIPEARAAARELRSRPRRDR